MDWRPFIPLLDEVKRTQNIEPADTMAVIEVAKSMGLRIVPAEPSAEMVEAAQAEWLNVNKRQRWDEDLGAWVSDYSDKIVDAWTAMLAAAPGQGGDGDAS